MNKEDFANSLLCEKVIDSILKLPCISKNISVLRVIKNHDATEPLAHPDFYPSIMERNGGAMPTYEKQESKTNLSQFGTSFFLNNDNSIQTIQSVPTLREEMKALAYGVISTKHGLVGLPDTTGHLVLYLFDPLGNELPHTFKYLEA